MTAELRLLSTLGMNLVMQSFGSEYEARTGVRLAATFAPTVSLLDRIRAGERGDVAILTAEGVDVLIADGVLDGRTDLARSFVGLAVRAGAPHPDISSPDGFVAALLGARSVAMSQAGASGIFMAGLLGRLGIADAMRDRSVILAQGYTASLLASGEADIAIQQVSELMVVPGVEIVGRLPAELGGDIVFAAGRFRGTPAPMPARALVAALADPARHKLYRRCGLEPTGSAGPIRS